MRMFLLSFLFLAGCSSQFTPYSEAVLSKEEGRVTANRPAGAFVVGTVTINPKLAGKVSPNDTIFVIVKQGEGPPLAVKKMRGGHFPMKFELGSDDVMIPGTSFEGEIVIVARVDKDGNAGPPEPGDLEGRTKKMVPVGDQSVEVKIDKLF